MCLPVLRMLSQHAAASLQTFQSSSFCTILEAVMCIYPTRGKKGRWQVFIGDPMELVVELRRETNTPTPKTTLI